MVLLHQGEKILMQDTAKLDDHGRGTLTLTNFNITFEQTTGLFSKKTEIVFQSGIGWIRNVGDEGWLNKALVIDFKSSKGKLWKAKFTGVNPDQWIASIKSAVQGEEEPGIEKPEAERPTQGDLIRKFIDKVIKDR